MATKTELAGAVYSMLESLAVYRDHAGLISSIGPGRAAEFNGLVRQAQAALSGVRSVYQIDILMEYDSVVTLISRLTILKTIIDHATGRQWLGYRDRGGHGRSILPASADNSDRSVARWAP